VPPDSRRDQAKQAQQPPAARVVDLKAADGTILKATYFAATKPGPGVLLLHQGNRARKSWDELAGQLAAAGINTLTLVSSGWRDTLARIHFLFDDIAGCRSEDRHVVRGLIVIASRGFCSHMEIVFEKTVRALDITLRALHFGLRADQILPSLFHLLNRRRLERQ
jgi:hypothetical protein